MQEGLSCRKFKTKNENTKTGNGNEKTKIGENGKWKKTKMYRLSGRERERETYLLLHEVARTFFLRREKVGEREKERVREREKKRTMMWPYSIMYII